MSQQQFDLEKSSAKQSFDSARVGKDDSSFRTRDEIIQDSYHSDLDSLASSRRPSNDILRDNQQQPFINEISEENIIEEVEEDDGLPDIRTPHDIGSASWKNHWLMATSEFCGTFVFLFFAYIICNHAGNAWDHKIYPSTEVTHASSTVQIAFGFGMGVMVAIYMFGNISGGHFNPAVTLFMFMMGQMTFARAIVHWLAQMTGAMAAGGIVAVLTPGQVNYINTLSMHTSRSRGLFLEMFGTSFFVLLIYVVCVENQDPVVKGQAPMIIGFTLFAVHLALVPITGCGVNPARSFGAALAGKSFANYHWIYWVGPIFGCVLAWGMHRTLYNLHYKELLKIEDKCKRLRKEEAERKAAQGH